MSHFHSLQANGKILIEDNAQAGLRSPSMVDYSFNSLRKFLPYDGGYLFTQRDLTSLLSNEAAHASRRLDLIHRYRRDLANLRANFQPEPAELDHLLIEAEDAYTQERVIFGDSHERDAIERFDWARLAQTRRRNDQYLLDRLHDLPQLTPLFPCLPDDVVPLGLPIYCEGVSRAALLPGLAARGIWLPVHWSDLPNHPVTQRNVFAVEMARKMLTLPVDQYTTPEQLDYLVGSLREEIEQIQSW